MPRVVRSSVELLALVFRLPGEQAMLAGVLVVPGRAAMRPAAARPVSFCLQLLLA